MRAHCTLAPATSHMVRGYAILADGKIAGASGRGCWKQPPEVSVTKPPRWRASSD